MNRELINELTKKLADDGKIIEAGWVGLKMMAIPPSAGETQVNEMRKAFFAGAQHLLGSIMSMLDPGPDETAADMDRMTKIHQELEIFKREFLDSVSV